LKRALTFCGIASTVLMYPFAISYWRISTWEMWLYLVPGAVVIPLSYVALPLAHQLRELSDDGNHHGRRMLAQSIVVLTLTSVLMLGWVVPIANQQWRTMTYAAISKSPYATAPARGIRELTIPELFFDTSEGPRRQAVQRETHNRAALALSPITLGAMGWILWRPRRRRTSSAFLGWVIGGVSFYQLSVIGRGAEDAYSLFAGAGFWLAHVIAILGLVLYSMYKPYQYERRV
jgi:lipopolysaccharide export LptBFGC system permease protein LptF